MFIDEKKMGTQMKKAYKDKLIIGDIEEGLVISNAHWLLWIDNDYVSNKVKALVVEYAGLMPGYGQVFSVSKAEPNPQFMIDVDYIINIIQGHKNAYDNYMVTPILLSGHKDIRLLQHNKSKEIYAIDQECLSLVDKSKIDYEIESEPLGPCSRTSTGNEFYWYNGICIYYVLPIGLKDNDVAIGKALKNVDFSKKGEEM